MAVMKTVESFQATYAATSVPKTVILACLKKIKMICDKNFKNQILTACILEFVFSDCLLHETIIDSCNKLCSVESILKTLCGMVTMQDLKIIINEEYYCQMRKIMIGKI